MFLFYASMTAQCAPLLTSVLAPVLITNPRPSTGCPPSFGSKGVVSKDANQCTSLF
jgi:hypothetical protein